MYYNFFRTLLVLSLTLLLSACGNGTDSQSADNQAAPASDAGQTGTPDEAPASGETADSGGDPGRGETLFNQPVIAGTPGCVTCHSLQPGVRMVGPSLADVGTVAETAVEGMSATAFLRQSIVEPNAHVTEGFSPGLMFQDYEDKLSPQQVDDLVAFLMTLK